MSAPDIKAGDFIRVFGGTGALRCGFELRRTLRLQVIAVGDPPGRPAWRYVSGRICRADLTHGNQIQHTSLEITGIERSILNLAGQWQLLRRPA